MNKSDSDYDARQFSLMEEQLSQFESGRIALPHLISGLKALQNCLRATSEDWIKEFTSEWWTLEQVHAVALDRKMTAMSSEDLVLIREAVANLRTLIARARETQARSQNDST